MSKVKKEQYEFALARVEELLPLVDDNTPANDRNAVELTMMSDIIIDYEKEHYPIGKHYVSGRAEPTLKIARMLCVTLGITPAAMLGC